MNEFTIYQTTKAEKIRLGKQLTHELSVCGGQASLITAEKHYSITLLSDL